VQTFVIGKVTNSLSAKLKVPVRIGRVNIHFFKTIVLEKVYVEDLEKDTLLYAGELRASIGLLSLAKKTITISYSGLDNARINIYRKKGSNDYNFAFIMQAFASTDTTAKDTTSGGWKFDMGEVELKNIRLGFYDYTLHTDISMALNDLKVDIKTLGLDDQNMKINDISLNGLALKYNMIADSTLKDAAAKVAQHIPPAAGSLKNKPATVFKISVGDIDIKESRIAYNNLNYAPQKKGIDFNHLNITGLNASLEDLAMAGNDFAGDIEKFTFRERSGFYLRDLAISGSLQKSRLHVELNKFVTANSSITDKITVDITDLANIQQALGDIKVEAGFDASVLSMKDILYFSPDLDSIRALQGARITVSGDLNGKLNNLEFKKANLALNDKNFIHGNFFMKGLPDINKLVFDIRVDKLAADGPYIQSLLPKNAVPANIAALGNISIGFNAKGNIHHFKTDSRINTSAGAADFDLSIQLNDKFMPDALSGKFSTTNLDLGKLLGPQTQLGPLTMTAQLSAKGKEVSKLEGTITGVYYNKYM
jgi:hypothetical protein